MCRGSDIKLENVMLGGAHHTTIKLVDFGTAKARPAKFQPAIIIYTPCEVARSSSNGIRASVWTSEAATILCCKKINTPKV